MKEILPFSEKSFLNAYSFLSYFLGILEGNGFNVKPFCYNNFLSLIYARTFDEHFIMFPKAFPEGGKLRKQFDLQKFKIELVTVDNLCHFISEGKYVIVTLNFRVIIKEDGFWYHDWLVYGFDSEQKVFKIIGFAPNTKIRLSYIEQDPYIFTNTLAYNIALNDEYDKERLLDAINKASLTEFVNKLPEGLNTIMDEECQQVSGGEKTRISLARALYSNANIMLFDEITASLDKKLSKNIDDYILKQQDQLIINIAHKYNRETLHLYDKIVKVSDGVLTEVTDIENL